VLAPITDIALREGANLVLQPVATDPDNDDLIFSLAGNPHPGVVIHPYTGRITWATGEGTGPATYPITVQVLDTGLPRLGATRTFQVSVSDDNSPPILDRLSDRDVREGELVEFTAHATDPDRPAQGITYTLGANAPAGASLNPVTGAFRWRPTASQGGSNYRIDIIARDNGTPALSTTGTCRIAVSDTRADFLVALGATTVEAGSPGSLPIQLTSDASLVRVAFDLLLDAGHLATLELEQVDDEVAFAGIDPIAPGRYRLAVELTAPGLIERTRTIGNLRFATTATGHSSVEMLRLDGVEGTRRNGESTRNALVRPGRVFVLEGEPLVDAAPGTNGRIVLTVHGRAGQTYRLQGSDAVVPGAGWREERTLQLQGLTGTLEVAPGTGTAGFFRVLKP
jgi:hypothetical protein